MNLTSQRCDVETLVRVGDIGTDASVVELSAIPICHGQFESVVIWIGCQLPDWKCPAGLVHAQTIAVHRKVVRGTVTG